MADEAFALSPISARAAQPREEDYAAISDAFMETSRGRWFLGEYARRNRNADTRMVLDAVARIEENLAAHKSPAPDNGLAEAVAAIRGVVDEARALASAALDGLALEQSLAPVRKGARVIREIAWRLREIGADGRICDLIDSQVVAIEAGCGHISSADARSGLRAAFDLIEQRIATFGDSEAPTPGTDDAVPSSPHVPADETPAAMSTARPADAASDMEATNRVVSSPETAVNAAPEVAAAPAVPAAPEVAVAPAEIAATHDEDAHDEAVLDMVAFEMAASDPADVDDPALADPADSAHDAHRLAQPSPAGLQAIAQAPEPPTAPVVELSREPSREQASVERRVEPAPEPSSKPLLQPSPESSPGPSLGASLIASGIVRRRHELAPDPLAPIRRLSQAEKIALFS